MMQYYPGIAKLNYDKTKCTGCKRCVEVCPHTVFEMKKSKADIVDKDACMECGACMRNCAFGAIQVEVGVGCAAALIGSYLPRRKRQICC